MAEQNPKNPLSQKICQTLKKQLLVRGCNTVRFNIRLNKMLKQVQLIDAFQATSNFNILSLFVASCEQVDVGVSWYILDNQLNASSELNASTPARNGRLNFVAGSSWCASTSDSSPYLQIDLQIPYCLLYTSPSPRDGLLSRMPSSA